MSKKTVTEIERELRNQHGIYDISMLSDISANKTAWVGVNQQTGEKVITRCDQSMMAYAVHSIGRYFASRAIDYSRSGRHEAAVRFDLYRFDDPSCKIEGITMSIPYQIALSYDTRHERITSKEAVDQVNKIQDAPRVRRSGPSKPEGSRHNLKCHYCHETGHPERRCSQKRHDLEKTQFKNR